MKKIKLPRKRKKQYIKDHGSITYTIARIVNETFLEDGDGNPNINPVKFIKHSINNRIGLLVRVTEYY